MIFDAIGFGALNLDRLSRVDHIAKAGEESFILDVAERPGGSAANVMVGMARLGRKVGYIGEVARDREGEIMLKDLEREGVDTRGIIVSNVGRSGVVAGYIDSTGERALYVDPGVNDTLEFEEVNLDYASSARFLHLTSFVGDKPLDAQMRLVDLLPNTRVTFDPGDIYARRGPEALRPILRRSFAVLPNLRELKLLTGEGYKKGSKRLIEWGARIVGVKLGRRGCYVTDGRGAHLVEAYEVPVVDTTGAGDAFCAGFLYGLLNNRDLYECGRIGNLIASHCVQKVGAREGLPRILDLHEL